MNFWNEALKILLVILLIVLTRYVIPAIKAYLDSVGEDKLYSQIADLVAAAEMLWPDSGTGAQKLEYVIDRLEELGVRYTDAVRAKIEAAVYRLEG